MLEFLSSLNLVVVCGATLSGKTSVAKYLSERLNMMHILDIDELRTVCFGIPEMTPTEANKRSHLIQYGAAYRVFFFAIEQQLAAIKKSLIVTVSLSSYKNGQVPLMNIADRTGARLKVIWLKANPAALSDEEISCMNAKRAKEQSDYIGTIGALHDIVFLRERHKTLEPIQIPGSVCLETWPEKSLELSCAEALKYVLNPDTGYAPK